MGVQGWKKGEFAYDFERELKVARKKAGRKVGGLVVRGRRKALGDVSSRRKKAVRNIVGRDGTLIVLDHAPLAQAQETGKIIRPRSAKALLVGSKKLRPGEKAFASGGYLFASNGTEKRLIGSFKKSVRIKEIAESKKLRTIATKYLDKYAEEIDKNLTEGY